MPTGRERVRRLRAASFGNVVFLTGTIAVAATCIGLAAWLLRKPIDIAVVVAAAIVAVVVQQCLVANFTDLPSESDGGSPFGPEESTTLDPFSSYHGLRFRVRASLGNPEQSSRLLLPTLGELVDDRLLRKHGVVREARSDRARALLGEEIWSILGSDESTKPLQIDDLERFLDALERL